MQWIKHDTNANQDAKLQEVLLDYGLDGYGLYWYCLELIAGKVSQDNITFELEHDARIIARNVGSTPQRVTEMMTRFVELGLFEDTEGRVTCLKIASRLDKSMTSNKYMRGIIEKLKACDNAGDLLSVTKSHYDVMTYPDSVMTCHDKIMTRPDSVMQDKIRLDKNRIDNKNILSSKPDKKPAVKKSKHDDLVKSVFDEWVHVMNKSANTKLTKERKKKIVDRCVEGYEFEDFKNAIYGCSITPHNMGANENGRLYNDIELICRTGTHLERFRDACKPVSPPQQYQSNPTRKKSLMERSHDDAQTALNIIERRAEQRQASHSDVHENGQLIRSQMADEGRLLSE